MDQTMHDQGEQSIPMASTASLGDYETFLSRLSDRDRLNVQRHVAACEAEPTTHHVMLWKKIACSLARLAPHAAQTASQHAIRFYVSDGKYRRQVFALEDLRDGNLVVYVVDALNAAVQAGALRGPVGSDGDAMLYEVRDQPGATVRIESLTARKTTSAPEYYRHMLGWNRRALKVTLPTTGTPAVIRALETLCVVAARQAKQ
jgi:hypothetical protein